MEGRTMLDGGGISAFMSLSFTPDGTGVTSQQSLLFDTFNRVATPDQWQSIIETSFNRWAIHTNADITRVQDQGDPLGTPGRREGDARFGDIRVAAAPLADNVMAISFPSDNVALGTWSSDIIFNSNADWTSLNQIASVALHEAGHIFGLEHSDDPTSSMYTHGASAVVVPTAADITNLQRLFGNRSVDPNETDEETNDEFEAATELAGNLGLELLSLAYGDISFEDDFDLFRIATEDEIEGSIFIRVETDGLSLLDPRVTLYNDDEEVLESVAAENGIATLAVELDDTHELFVSVEADPDSRSPVGRYSLAATLTEDDFDDEEYEEFSDGEFFSYESKSLREYVRSENREFFFEEDANSNDQFDSAQLVTPKSMNAGRTWYEEVGSISGNSDADVYVLESPDDADGSQAILTVTVQSLASGGLIPEATVFDELGDPVATEVVVNGNGELVIQTDTLASEQPYFIRVEPAHPEGSFARGNYKLMMNFGSNMVELHTFAEGMLTTDQPVQARPLYVAEPQLFHFLLEANAQSGPSMIVTMHIFDASDNVVHTLATPTNGERSANHPFLLPGDYTVRVGVEGDLPDGAMIDYAAFGVAISNPLGVVPVDPTAEPAFACDGASDQFCYPGGTTSDSPFFWDNFIQNYVEQNVNNGTAVDRTGQEPFWWDWYLQGGLGQQTIVPPPTSVPDQFRVRGHGPSASASGNVLQNDLNHSGGPLVAAVATGPVHGTLTPFAADGTFRYTPNADFLGIDTFSYQAIELNTPSSNTVVSIIVSQPGDTNDDGEVAFSDFLVLATHFGASNATWAEGDFNGDGVVSFEDFLNLSDNFGSSVALALAN